LCDPLQELEGLAYVTNISRFNAKVLQNQIQFKKFKEKKFIEDFKVARGLADNERIQNVCTNALLFISC
jgi:hypothetical protein